MWCKGFQPSDHDSDEDDVEEDESEETLLVLCFHCVKLKITSMSLWQVLRECEKLRTWKSRAFATSEK